MKKYSIQLSYDFSEQEKKQAITALLAFDKSIDLLKISNDHLNIMFIPFKDNPEIPKDQIIKFRAALRRFRDKVIENFNTFKVMSFKCVTLMQTFSSDTQTIKIMKSFINLIDDIEKQVNLFARLFDKLESNTFVADIIKSIEFIQKESKELENVVNERIKPHVQKNILGKTWVDDISNNLNVKIEKKKPFLLQLNEGKLNQIK